MNLFTRLTAAALAAGMIIAPAIAGELTPVGTWQTNSGESRYEVQMCGDGTALCATLVWLRDDARTPENLAFLNKQVVQAELSRPMKWEGQVTYDGKTYSGNVTMVDPETLRMGACKAIACKSVTFKRV